ncbi:hypothetical protein [Polycladidibacter hongkongensis]|uniref:hypothetical protein n=1 Tax=Polycladidibacter hongkongensis TaxID=1647556 RepID=UPI00082E5C64|nr:hypothetical protein [Pseudovibrio hongkongensis]
MSFFPSSQWHALAAKQRDKALALEQIQLENPDLDFSREIAGAKEVAALFYEKAEKTQQELEQIQNVANDQQDAKFSA